MRWPKGDRQSQLEMTPGLAAWPLYLMGVTECGTKAGGLSVGRCSEDFRHWLSPQCNKCKVKLTSSKAHQKKANCKPSRQNFEQHRSLNPPDWNVEGKSPLGKMLGASWKPLVLGQSSAVWRRESTPELKADASYELEWKECVQMAWGHPSGSLK